MNVNKLPDAGHIEGLLLDGPKQAPLQCQVELQYTDRTPQKNWHGLSMSMPDALYLLNLLEQMALDAKVEHLRRPPGQAQ